MKFSEKTLIVMMLGLQKALTFELDYGNILKELDFVENDNGELDCTNYDKVRITREEFEEKFGSFDEPDDNEEESDKQLDLFEDLN